MKKTCGNCAYMHGCLCEPNSQYHIHNYCEALDRRFECPMNSRMNSFLETYFADAMFVSADSQGVFDDIEAGIAGCYMFEPARKSDDDAMRERFYNNKALAIATIDKIFACKKYHNPLTGDIESIETEDVEYFSKLREELEALSYE